MSTRPARLMALTFLLAGLGLTFWGLYIPAKAWLAQQLLENAWANSHATQAVKPWPWADTWPVARLGVPGLGISQIVLEGAAGNSLAFGPGHMNGSAGPGESGNVVIAGHRDTHFRFLPNLEVGDRLHLEDARGTIWSYRIAGSEVVDSRSTRLVLLGQSDSHLTLVSCYPFDGLDPGGPLRYLVHAVLEP